MDGIIVYRKTWRQALRRGAFQGTVFTFTVAYVAASSRGVTLVALTVIGGVAATLFSWLLSRTRVTKEGLVVQDSDGSVRRWPPADAFRFYGPDDAPTLVVGTGAKLTDIPVTALLRDDVAPVVPSDLLTAIRKRMEDLPKRP